MVDLARVGMADMPKESFVTRKGLVTTKDRTNMSARSDMLLKHMAFESIMSREDLIAGFPFADKLLLTMKSYFQRTGGMLAKLSSTLKLCLCLTKLLIGFCSSELA